MFAKLITLSLNIHFDWFICLSLIYIPLYINGFFFYTIHLCWSLVYTNWLQVSINESMCISCRKVVSKHPIYLRQVNLGVVE